MRVAPIDDRCHGSAKHVSVVPSNSWRGPYLPQPFTTKHGRNGDMPHAHNFDPLSGWCGCGTRDTGERINRAGWVYRPRTEPTTQTTHEKDPTT